MSSFSPTANKQFSPTPSQDPLRVPPHSLEAEQAVLGGVMLDNSAWDKVVDRVNAADFYRNEHQLIFKAMSGLVENSQPLDVITVSEGLQKLNALEDAGGLAYLGELANNTPSAANISAYADIVRERAVLRSLVTIGSEITESATRPEGRKSQEILDEAERKVFQIAEKGSKAAGPESIKQVVAKSLDKIEKRFNDKNAINGLSTGFSDFDRMTSGLQDGDLVIVAGRPSMGKTVLGLNIAENAAMRSNKAVLFFSMEMPSDAIATRLLASLGRIDMNKIRTGQLMDDDWSRLSSAVGLLSESKLFIDESAALSPTEVRARARRLAREQDLGLIVIDYLQLMRASGHVENRTAEISEISRSLKGLAKELNVPVVALSQLNRSLEQRPNKRPVMSDLRECVTGDTLVCLSDGRRKPIKELVGQTPNVLAMDENQKIIHAKSDCVWSKGIKPIYKLTTASGRVLRATIEHRIFTDAGWKKIKDCQQGASIGVAWRFVSKEEAIQERYKRLNSSKSKVENVAAFSIGSNLNTEESDLFWDTIIGIEPDGEEEVFDLTVPGPASWLADGLVSHNSGAIEQDADLIVFIYRDEVYNEDSPDKGTAEIIVGKHRNGPIGTIRLTFLGQFVKFENFLHETSFVPES